MPPFWKSANVSPMSFFIVFRFYQDIRWVCFLFNCNKTDNWSQPLKRKTSNKRKLKLQFNSYFPHRGIFRRVGVIEFLAASKVILLRVLLRNIDDTRRLFSFDAAAATFAKKNHTCHILLCADKVKILNIPSFQHLTSALRPGKGSTRKVLMRKVLNLKIRLRVVLTACPKCRAFKT